MLHYQKVKSQNLADSAKVVLVFINVLESIALLYLFHILFMPRRCRGPLQSVSKLPPGPAWVDPAQGAYQLLFLRQGSHELGNCQGLGC